MVVTWLSRGCHVVVKWLSRGCQVVVTWLSSGCHVVVGRTSSLKGLMVSFNTEQDEALREVD